MKGPTPLILSGFFIFIFAAAFGFGGLDIIIHCALKKMLVLTHGSEVWDLWRTMPVPIYFRVRFFNITNPDDVAAGEKAIVEELGPYTYMEDWEKVDISEDEQNGTVRYRMTRQYFFHPSLSGGTEDDNVTFINFVFLSTLAMAKKHVDEEGFMLSQLDRMLTDKGEMLTKTATVRELMFDGFSVQPYVDLFENPLVQQVAEEMGIGIPENMRDGKLGFFKNKNGSDHGWFVIQSGLKNPEKVGEILSHDDEEVLTAWSGEPCNRINGTDGTFYPPFLHRDKRVDVYSPLMCRSIGLAYHADGKIGDVETYKFVASLKNWMSPKSNPDNWCFRTPNGNGTEDWVHDGVFNIAPCYFGAPILLSQPHFYGADDWVQNGVEGLKPDFEKHMTMMEFHPLTGSTVKARARMQLNVEVIPYPEVATVSDARSAIIPILWVEEGSDLSGEALDRLLLLSRVRNGVFYAKFLVMGIGLILIGTGVLVLIICRRGKAEAEEIRSRWNNTSLELAAGRAYEVSYAYD